MTIIAKNIEEELSGMLSQAIVCGGIPSQFQQTVRTSLDDSHDSFGADNKRIMFSFLNTGSWSIEINNNGLEKTLLLNEELILNIKNDLGKWIDKSILWAIGAIIPVDKEKAAKPNLKRFDESLNAKHISLLSKWFDENGISHDDRYIALNPLGIERLSLSIQDFKKDAIVAIAKGKFYFYKGFYFTSSKLIPENQGFVWQKQHVVLGFLTTEGDINRVKMVCHLHKAEKKTNNSEVKLSLEIHIGAIRISERGAYSLSYNDPVQLINLKYPTWR